MADRNTLGDITDDLKVVSDDQPGPGTTPNETPIRLTVKNEVNFPLPSITAHSQLYLNTSPTPDVQSNPSKITTSNQPLTLSTEERPIPNPDSEPEPPLPPRLIKLQSLIETLTSQIASTQTLLSQTLATLRLRHTQGQSSPPIKSKADSNSTNTPQPQPEPESESDEKTLSRARQIVSSHIKLLHQYNEIKDVGLGLLGLIADKEGRRLGEVMGERGVEEGD